MESFADIVFVIYFLLDYFVYCSNYSWFSICWWRTIFPDYFCEGNWFVSNNWFTSKLSFWFTLFLFSVYFFRIVLSSPFLVDCFFDLILITYLPIIGCFQTIFCVIKIIWCTVTQRKLLYVPWRSSSTTEILNALSKKRRVYRNITHLFKVF